MIGKQHLKILLALKKAISALLLHVQGWNAMRHGSRLELRLTLDGGFCMLVAFADPGGKGFHQSLSISALCT